MLQCQKLLEQIRVHEETDKQAKAESTKGGWIMDGGRHEDRFNSKGSSLTSDIGFQAEGEMYFHTKMGSLVGAFGSSKSPRG